MNVSMENLYVDVGAYRVKDAETIFVQNTNCDHYAKNTQYRVPRSLFFL